VRPEAAQLANNFKNLVSGQIAISLNLVKNINDNHFQPIMNIYCE